LYFRDNRNKSIHNISRSSNGSNDKVVVGGSL
jgi:hypothetical protein